MVAARHNDPTAVALYLHAVGDLIECALEHFSSGLHRYVFQTRTLFKTLLTLILRRMFQDAMAVILFRCADFLAKVQGALLSTLAAAPLTKFAFAAVSVTRSSRPTHRLTIPDLG